MTELQIIGEVGSTFFRDTEQESLDVALRSIRTLASCGATAVKFQLFRADTLYSKTRAVELYERAKMYELNEEWIPRLAMCAHENDLEFGLSFFDATLLNDFVGYVDFIKIASGDITYYPLLELASEKSNDHGIPLIVSTGASTGREIANIASLLWTKYRVKNLVLMHCISQYPATIFDMQIRAGMTILSRIMMGHNYGLSDHTIGSITSCLALAMGATWFEKHFTLEENIDNPDDIVALDPDDFKNYVHNLRDADRILGKHGERVIPRYEQYEREMIRRDPSDWLRPMNGDEDE